MSSSSSSASAVAVPALELQHILVSALAARDHADQLGTRVGMTQEVLNVEVLMSGIVNVVSRYVDHPHEQMIRLVDEGSTDRAAGRARDARSLSRSPRGRAAR